MSTETVGESEGLPARRRTLVMLAVVCGVLLMSLDGAIANIALPTIARDLEVSDAATVWIVNAYNVGSVICLLPAAALGEIFGLKRVYAFGLILFTLSSLACALAPSLAVLIAARLAQGVGTACTAAIGPAVVRDIFPRRMIGSGLAMIALSVAVGGTAGPTVASLILSVATWPWLFLVNVPIGMIAVPMFIALARPGRPEPRPFDYVATLLAAAALGLLLVGVDTLGKAEHGMALGEIAVGLVCGVLLVGHQSGRTNALLPLDLLKIPLLSLSLVTSICSYSAQILAYVSLPFLFETVMHRSQIATGLLVTPWPLMIVIAAPIAGRLSARYPAALLGSIGLALLATGLGLMAALPDQPADWNIAWRMALCGIGFGFFQTPNNATIMTAGPQNRAGAAGGMLAVARTLGWCVGSALVTLI
ncbi:MAG TPA: MFS transporter, partial [Reyranella sp.]|nr:MFS transporter [Reyranella sp.]